MSFRIDNGYRLQVRRSRNGEHSFEAVKAVLDDFKHRARPVIQGLVSRRAAYLCARIIDHRTLDLPVHVDGVVVPNNYSPMMGAMKILLDRYGAIFEHGCSDSVYAFDAHVTVVPINGEVLALLWTEQAALRAVWEDTERVVPFPYWDNDLRPENVSEEEWALREAIWVDAAGDDVWAVGGFSTEVIGRYGIPIPYIDAVMAYLPPLRERAKLYAFDRVVRRQFRRRNPGKDTAIQWVALHQALQDVRGSREGNAELQVTCEEIEKALPTISGTMLAHEPSLLEPFH